MRVVVLLKRLHLLITLLYLCPFTGAAQVISIDFHEVPLATALSEMDSLSSNHQIHFIYDHLKDLTVTAKIVNKTIPEAVEIVCKKQPVKVKVKGQDIFVKVNQKEMWLDQPVEAAIRPIDIHTSQYIRDGMSVILTDADSNVIMRKDTLPPIALYLNIPDRKGGYTLHFQHPQYKPKSTPLWKMSKREQYYYIEAHMERAPIRAKSLKEITVTASKVKFYYRGDTLVYNADAFLLAEGSMLDALIAQLPGVELTPDGKIYVQGRYVESLLLNGKDFFKGDNSVLLENLPAYTVKELKVYDKYGKLSELTNLQLSNDSHYVMDVRLKREYQIGWMSNLEAGIGTNERWQGRLFTMRYTPHSQVSTFGNVNKLGDRSEKYGNGNEILEGLRENPDATVVKGGANYHITNVQHGYEFGGQASFSHINDRQERRINQESFHTGGSSFSRSWSHATNQESRVNIGQNFQYTKPGSLYLNISPAVAWTKWHKQSDRLSGEFSADPATYANLEDSLFQPQMGRHLLQMLVNHIREERDGEGHQIEGNLRYDAIYTIPHTNDAISFTLEGRLNNRKNQDFDISRLNYISTGYQDFRHRLTEDPSNSYNIMSSVFYSYSSALWTVQPQYHFLHDYQRQENSIYRLDQLAELANQDELTLLPSTQEVLFSTLDADNSYFTTAVNTQHQFSVDIIYPNQQVQQKPLHIHLLPQLTLQRQRLDYEGNINTSVSQSAPLFKFHSKIDYLQKSGDITFTYDLNNTLPPNFSLLGLYHNNDPLNIREGNSNLKTTWNQAFSLSYRPKNLFLASVNFNIAHNSIANGYVYDPKTGVRTYRPENINGNWNLGSNLGIVRSLDKKQRLQAHIHMTYSYHHSVDLLGISGSISPAKSVVHNHNFNIPLRLDYQKGKWKVGGSINFRMRMMRSPREDFQPINTQSIIYGLSGQGELPWKIQWSSQLNYNTCYGYTDDAMNRKDLVWNAQLSRSIFNGKLSLSLVAFDILDQLSNIRYTVNSQGHTETWCNVLRRYALLKITWKFHQLPKKRESTPDITPPGNL